MPNLDFSGIARAAYNNVKLNLGTSLINGGEVTINGGDNTKFDVAAGSADFVNNYTDPFNPTINTIKWTDKTAISLTGSPGQFVTWIHIDQNGDIVQTAVPFPVDDLKDYVLLGLLTHLAFPTISGAASVTLWQRDSLNTLAGLYVTLGPVINVSGNVYSANGANLKINKSEGISDSIGVNYGNSKKDPNQKASTEVIATSFILFYRSPAGPIVSLTDLIPVDKYDPNGDGVLVNIPTNYFVPHRIYFDPLTNITLVQYGQFAYDSLKKAILSAEKESFIQALGLERLGLRSILAIKQNATALNDKDDAKFIELNRFGDRTLNKIPDYSKFAENIEIIDGMSYQRPSITYVNSGGVIYLDLEADGSGDLTYAFEQREFILNCTTGAGVSGRARAALTAGTATVPVQNYVYVTRSGDVAQLNASTTFPTGQFGWVCDVLVPDATTFDSRGVYSSQRYSDNKSHDGRGALSYEREKIRALGTTYESGIVPTITITDLTPDTLDFSVTSGEIYQLHKSAFPALDSTVNGVYVINHPTTPWLYTDEVGDIQVDANGSTLNNRSFNFVFIGIQSSADGVNYSKLGLLLPSGSYGYTALSQALSDENNTAITSVPAEIKKTAFLICRVTFKYKNGVWNNVTADETAVTFFDLRGNPLGAQTGGAGTPSVTEFLDSVFKILDDLDVTKALAFQCSAITTGQTRVITVADRDLNLSTPIFDSCDIDNVNINGNTIYISQLNGEMYIKRNGTGSIRLGDGNVTSNVGMLVLDGTVSSIEGPHIAAFVSGDNTHPVFQGYYYAHDEIALLFDAYFDGTNWKSSDSGSNFSIIKNEDALSFLYDSGITAGNTLSWNIGFRMNTSGQIGIGTITLDADSILTLYGGGSTSRMTILSTDDTSKLSLGIDSSGNAIINNEANKYMQFLTNNTERMRIEADGVLNVGDTVNADGQNVSIRAYNSTGTWKGGGAFGYTGATVIMGELTGAAVIGGHNANLSAWADLYINTGGGKVFMPTVYNNPNAGGRDVYIQATGELTYLSSTLESKINIADFNTDFFYELRPKVFNNRLKDSNDNYTEEYDAINNYGLIAQEVETVNQDLVFYDEIRKDSHSGQVIEQNYDGTYPTENVVIENKVAGIYYSKLIAILIKVNQEQKTEIDNLKNEINDIKSRLSILENG